MQRSATECSMAAANVLSFFRHMWNAVQRLYRIRIAGWLHGRPASMQFGRLERNRTTMNSLIIVARSSCACNMPCLPSCLPFPIRQCMLTKTAIKHICRFCKPRVKFW